MAAEPLTIRGEGLRLEDVRQVARAPVPVRLDPGAIDRMEGSRRLVERFLAAGQGVYGVTTGFGKFADVLVSPEQAAELQRNLLRSHACGVGRPFSEEEVRAALLLRANALARGYSGIRVSTVELLLEFLNRGIHPVVPEQGSLGASGDLAPLAHIALVLIGEGEALYQGEHLPGDAALRRAGLLPVKLTAKEGLALINGTQVMSAVGGLAAVDALMLARTADLVSALTVEALRGIPAAFDERLHELRPHPGQLQSAANLRLLLEGSRWTTEPGVFRVQDAYAIRCIPQVHGASREAIDFAAARLTTEINSVTDNPLLFPQDGLALSGGNFHGQPVALALDFLGIAVAELANISERRIERLVNPHLNEGLPAFLTRQAGLHSGLMLLQYTAAALVSENKVLAHPASVDSIPSSANQEDHVSMGTIAARKTRDILRNAERVLAGEAIAAAQAVDLREGPEGLAPATRTLYEAIRERVEFVDADRSLGGDIEEVAHLIRRGRLLEAAEEEVGEALR